MEGFSGMYGAGVGPVKATCTQWINLKLCVVIKKFSLYTEHVHKMISTKSNAQEKSSLIANLTKISGCKSIAGLWPLHIYLAEDSNFSILTKEQSTKYQ